MSRIESELHSIFTDGNDQESRTGLTRSDSLEKVSGQVKDMYRQFEGKYVWLVHNIYAL